MIDFAFGTKMWQQALFGTWLIGSFAILLDSGAAVDCSGMSTRPLVFTVLAVFILSVLDDFCLTNQAATSWYQIYVTSRPDQR